MGRLFAPDIPFQDEPYKFYGLPGLIVKIEDATGSHIMTLVGNKKVIVSADDKEVELLQNIRVYGMGGKEMSDPNQVFREMEKRTKESLTKNNNPIELDLVN